MARALDFADARRRGPGRRASVVGGGATLALALAAAVIVWLPPTGDTVVFSEPDRAFGIVPEVPLPPTSDPEPAPDEPAPSTPDAQETPQPQARPPSPTPAPEQEPETATEDEEPDYGAPLWGRRFVAVAASENGQPRPLPASRQVKVSFSYRTDVHPPQRWIGWSGGCNGFGSLVEVIADRLVVGSGWAGTMRGCPDDQDDQDGFVTGLVRSNPYWRLDGDRLWLWTDDALVEWREDTEPRPQCRPPSRPAASDPSMCEVPEEE